MAKSCSRAVLRSYAAGAVESLVTRARLRSFRSRLRTDVHCVLRRYACCRPDSTFLDGYAEKSRENFTSVLKPEISLSVKPGEGCLISRIGVWSFDETESSQEKRERERSAIVSARSSFLFNTARELVFDGGLIRDSRC